MVSYFNPVPMFTRSAHTNHSAGASTPYLVAPYASYPAQSHSNSHGSIHPPGINAGGNGSSVAPSSAQYATTTPEFNCNHQYASHQVAYIDNSTGSHPWSHNSTSVYSPCPRNFEDWPAQHPHAHSHHHGPHAPVHTSAPFFVHPQQSPPRSPCHQNRQLDPNLYSSFKLEFASHNMGDSVQENSSPEIRQPQLARGTTSTASATPSIGTPHSPDSGMAISDGVSSTGSPATALPGQAICLGPSSVHVPLLPSSRADHYSSGTGSSSEINLSHQRPAPVRSPYEWMKKPTYNISTTCPNGKTRTKDKYRVVYSDTQRLELEKEFHYSRYITIRRKAELASILGLSERQVKIWFQNRRAKERKIVRKREDLIQREKMAMAHIQSSVPPPSLTQVTSQVYNSGMSHSNVITV